MGNAPSKAGGISFNMRNVRMDGERYTEARTGKRRTYSFNIRNVGIDSESVIKMAEQRSSCCFNMKNVRKDSERSYAKRGRTDSVVSICEMWEWIVKDDFFVEYGPPDGSFNMRNVGMNNERYVGNQLLRISKILVVLAQ